MEKVFSWTDPKQAIRSEVEYWAQQSIEDRVSAVETIREATLKNCRVEPSEALRGFHQTSCTGPAVDGFA